MQTIHRSLIDEPLYAGVPRRYLAIEGMLAGLFIAQLGAFSIGSLIVVVFTVGVVHPALRRACRHDTLLLELYARSVFRRRRYPAYSPLIRSARRVASSVPLKLA